MLRREFLSALPFAATGTVPCVKINDAEPKYYREVYKAVGSDWLSVKWEEVKPGDTILLSACNDGDIGRGGWGGKLRGWEYFKVKTIEPGIDGQIVIDGEVGQYFSLPMTPVAKEVFHRLVEIPEQLLKARRVAILKILIPDSMPLLPEWMMVQSSSPHCFFPENAMAHRVVSEKFPVLKPYSMIPIFNSVQELEDYAAGARKLMDDRLQDAYNRGIITANELRQSLGEKLL
jgi:hypothetical protein